MDLKPAKGSTHSSRRLGRGQGSGLGGTSTRGHKGQKSRSGYSAKRHHEGGQLPLQMRLPKRGFKYFRRKEYVALNLHKLEMISESLGTKDITVAVLYENKYIKKNDLVKLLGVGELSKSINVTVHACSASAKQAVEDKGGSVTLL